MTTTAKRSSRILIPEEWEMREFGGQMVPFQKRPEGDLEDHRMVSFVRAPKGNDFGPDDPVIEIVGSAQTVDSYETVFIQRGMDDSRFKTNPVFLRQHRSSELPLGRAESWRREKIKVRVPGKRAMQEVDATIFVIRFDVAETPEEDDDWQRVARSYLNRYKNGFLRGASIGFRIPRGGMLFGDEMEEKDRDKYGISERGAVFTKWQLTELSAVDDAQQPQRAEAFGWRLQPPGTCRNPQPSGPYRAAPGRNARPGARERRGPDSARRHRGARRRERAGSARGRESWGARRRHRRAAAPHERVAAKPQELKGPHPMTTETENKPNTGNPALDSALLDLQNARSDFEESIKPLRENSATNGNRLDEMHRQFEEHTTQLREIAEKLATFDAPVGMDEKERKDFDMGRVAQAVFLEKEAKTHDAMTRAWDDAGFEKDVLEQTQTNQKRQVEELARAMGTTNDETGGVLVPSDAISDWIGLLRAKLVLRALGARVMTGLTGHRLPIPGMSQGATAAWYGESDELAASDQKFKLRYLDPHRCGSFVPVANNLLRWSPQAVRDIINEDMAAALALKVEDGILFGAGAEDAPLGIIHDTGILTHAFGANGDRFKIRDVPEFELLMEEANLNIDDSAGFLFHPRIKRKLKQEGVEQFTSQGLDSGQPYTIPGISDEAVASLLGYPYQTTTAIPTNLTKGSSTGICTYIFFALWNQLIIGQWGGIRFRASNESGNGTLGSAFLKDQTWLVVEGLFDGLMRRPEALVLASDALKDG